MSEKIKIEITVNSKDKKDTSEVIVNPKKKENKPVKNEMNMND